MPASRRSKTILQLDDPFVSFKDDDRAPVWLGTFDLQAFQGPSIWLLVDQITDVQHPLRDADGKKCQSLKHPVDSKAWAPEEA